MNIKTEPQEIVIEVTEEEFKADLETGLAEDEVLQPGRHIFRRGGFLARHRVTPKDVSTPGKVSIAINLDSDVFTYFKERAERSKTASYQTEINAALRDAMAREQA
ncbi:MAG: BrnA antitoxin family protein [Caldilineaceae bacterium]|nr:BrnA antitoxin family protein [Caldilineaceae bacterium]